MEKFSKPILWMLLLLLMAACDQMAAPTDVSEQAILPAAAEQGSIHFPHPVVTDRDVVWQAGDLDAVEGWISAENKPQLNMWEPSGNSANPAQPCKLPHAPYGDGWLGVPRLSGFTPSRGTVRAAVLFADFNDAPSTRTVDEVFSMVSPGAETYFSQVSNGRMNLQLQPHKTWLRLSQPSAHYGAGLRTFEGHRAFIQEAVDLADASVDFRNANLVIVLANPDATALPAGPAFGTPDPAWGIQADGVSIPSGVTSGHDLLHWGPLWLNHEMGHNMTLPDLYAYDSARTQADVNRFTGIFSLMSDIGGRAPELFAFERWMLGWIDDWQIRCQVSGDVTTRLTAIERHGGMKAIMIPTGQSSAVVIESRRALGYDVNINKGGALVYIVDTATTRGRGPIRVLPVHPNDPLREQSPLGVGESYSVRGVTITVVDASLETDTVRVVVTK